jgi:hypothetical protein
MSESVASFSTNDSDSPPSEPRDILLEANETESPLKAASEYKRRKDLVIFSNSMDSDLCNWTVFLEPIDGDELN